MQPYLRECRAGQVRAGVATGIGSGSGDVVAGVRQGTGGLTPGPAGVHRRVCRAGLTLLDTRPAVGFSRPSIRRCGNRLRQAERAIHFGS